MFLANTLNQVKPKFHSNFSLGHKYIEGFWSGTLPLLPKLCYYLSYIYIVGVSLGQRRAERAYLLTINWWSIFISTIWKCAPIPVGLFLPSTLTFVQLPVCWGLVMRRPIGEFSYRITGHPDIARNSSSWTDRASTAAVCTETFTNQLLTSARTAGEKKGLTKWQRTPNPFPCPCFKENRFGKINVKPAVGEGQRKLQEYPLLSLISWLWIRKNSLLKFTDDNTAIKSK